MQSMEDGRLAHEKKCSPADVPRQIPRSRRKASIDESLRSRFSHGDCEIAQAAPSLRRSAVDRRHRAAKTAPSPENLQRMGGQSKRTPGDRREDSEKKGSQVRFFLPRIYADA